MRQGCGVTVGEAGEADKRAKGRRVTKQQTGDMGISASGRPRKSPRASIPRNTRYSLVGGLHKPLSLLCQLLSSVALLLPHYPDHGTRP